MIANVNELREIKKDSRKNEEIDLKTEQKKKKKEWTKKKKKKERKKESEIRGVEIVKLKRCLQMRFLWSRESKVCCDWIKRGPRYYDYLSVIVVVTTAAAADYRSASVSISDYHVNKRMIDGLIDR